MGALKRTESGFEEIFPKNEKPRIESTTLIEKDDRKVFSALADYQKQFKNPENFGYNFHRDVKFFLTSAYSKNIKMRFKMDNQVYENQPSRQKTPEVAEEYKAGKGKVISLYPAQLPDTELDIDRTIIIENPREFLEQLNKVALAIENSPDGWKGQFRWKHNKHLEDLFDDATYEDLANPVEYLKRVEYEMKHDLLPNLEVNTWKPLYTDEKGRSFYAKTKHSQKVMEGPAEFLIGIANNSGEVPKDTQLCAAVRFGKTSEDTITIQAIQMPGIRENQEETEPKPWNTIELTKRGASAKLKEEQESGHPDMDTIKRLQEVIALFPKRAEYLKFLNDEFRGGLDGKIIISPKPKKEIKENDHLRNVEYPALVSLIAFIDVCRAQGIKKIVVPPFLPGRLKSDYTISEEITNSLVLVLLRAEAEIEGFNLVQDNLEDGYLHFEIVPPLKSRKNRPIVENLLKTGEMLN